jgi:hypothetical protein
MSERNLDRDRGFLTKKDRQFLRGELEYEREESAIHKRADIRERTRNALLDFTLLFQELDPKDREQIFEDHDYSLRRGMIDVIAFIAVGLSDDIDYDGDGHRIRTFERILDMAFGRAYRELDLLFDDFSLAINSFDQSAVDTLKEMVHSDKPPAPDRVKLLLETDQVDFDKLHEFLREEVDPPKQEE